MPIWLYIVIGIIGILVIIAIMHYGSRFLSGLVPKIFKEPVALGGSCTLHTDCKGYLESGIRCCGPVGKQVCVEPAQDWTKGAVCPEECVGWVGGKPGSCKEVNSKNPGDPCVAPEQCKGFKGAGKEGTFCCGKDGKKTCQQMEKDWVGTYYCPDECVGWAAGPPNTCGDRGTKKLGATCKYKEECIGLTDFGATGAFCCPEQGSKKCRNKVKDYAGFYYCPEECVGWLGALPGTCATVGTKDIGVDCLATEQCIGYTGPAGPNKVVCCTTTDGKKKTCQKLIKDWADAYYCPAECVGWPAGPPNTCGDRGTKKLGARCKYKEECIGLTDFGATGAFCCPEKGSKKCRNKVKDYSGVYYCPQECVGWLGALPGTCATVGTKDIGGDCLATEQCKGYTGPAGPNKVVCCTTADHKKKTCQKLVKDNANAYYCPAECVGWLGGPPNTCGTKETKKLGELCTYPEQCIGYSGLGMKGTFCCTDPDGKKRCRDKIKDHADRYYCPTDCVGYLAGPKGSCHHIGSVELGKTCTISPHCKGYVGPGKAGAFCCADAAGYKTCQTMVKDYIGNDYYCPGECVGWLGGPPGSCGSRGTVAEGGSCQVTEQCKGYNNATTRFACCGGKCQKMQIDYDGAYYCPSDCAGWFGGPKGYCDKVGTVELDYPCTYSQECRGYLGANQQNSSFCCSGKCKKLVKDWVGAYYCPGAAVLAPK